MAHPFFDVGEMNMPGGIGYIDATNILEEGTEDIKPETILRVEGFTLQDTMSAIEIMDSRMDTGMVEPQPSFDPHTPLLPSEVCWILDRAFACEMSWHAGLALSQTVYTLQYVHHLTDIAYPHFNADHKTRPAYAPKDSERPIELVTLVLRAGVFGLLKCCDLVWRELANDNLVDGEDWNGEKFGVSLCEDIQSDSVMSLLDAALDWLQESLPLSFSLWRTPLLERILLRKDIFRGLAYPSLSAIPEAKRSLKAILAGPVPPEPSATVKDVFDPTIARRLVAYVPTRVAHMAAQAEVWEAVSMWLDGWEEVQTFMGAKDLKSFKMLVSLRAYQKHSPRRSAFLRSLSISTFFNGQRILLRHEPPWLINRFFWEIAFVDAEILSRLERRLLEESNNMSVSSPTEQTYVEREHGPSSSICSPNNSEKLTELFEKGLAKLIVDLFNSFFHNRARQRRKLADSLLDWHLAFDQALIIVAKLSPSSPNLALSRIPLCVRHTRLSVIIEVLFAGFELELYTSDEWAMIYWYAGQVLSTQVAVLEELRSLISKDNGVANSYEGGTYVSFHLEFQQALRCFSIAMRDLLYYYSPAKAKINASREKANFERRFKWAFITGYEEASTTDEDRPLLGKWRIWRSKQDIDGSFGEATKNLARAREVLSRLSEYEPTYTGATFCPEVYKKFILGLVRTCDANLKFLRVPPEIRAETGRDWCWISCRWFPEARSPDIPP